MPAVSWDTSRVDAMLQRIEDRARRAWGDEVMAVANSGAAQVGNISDPDLAASVHGTLGRNDPSRFSSLIVSDEPRARFVFANSRPTVPAEALTSELAALIFGELFR